MQIRYVTRAQGLPLLELVERYFDAWCEMAWARMSIEEQIILAELAPKYSQDFNCLKLNHLQLDLPEQERVIAHAAVTMLRARGYVECEKGLMTEDQQPFGSGYAATELGWRLWQGRQRYDW